MYVPSFSSTFYMAKQLLHKDGLFILFCLLVSIQVDVSLAVACHGGQVYLYGVCADNDISLPPVATKTSSPKGVFTMVIGPSVSDPTYVEFVITNSLVATFFVTFSGSFLNSDVVLFTPTTTDEDGFVVTAVDSFF